ncbi:MAG TPA: hypothetical protein DD670_20660 [Planctomycetaceae bacterium]|nr:hypothetical protein [Planctomycetaceae bacterium]
MNFHPIHKWCAVVALATFVATVSVNEALFAQLEPAQVEQDMQVLTRGPVHEAFAETVTYDPEPGIVTPTAPPAAIEEIPPEQRLEGDNVAWIPGYWAWDDERNDYLWISGIWRALPPGRQWVPGYWSNAGQEYQWTSGYWADAQASEVEYLPEPPATVEAGPNIAAPSADHTWLPGCWIWQQNRYAWRPGYWATVQPDWVWIPARYVWAPRGYVFVDGYWDYSVGRRGMLFAPVYFNRSVYGRRGFSYTPRTVIDLGVFANHLFFRPRYQHYYFGDYYAANYRSAGYYPRYSVNTSRFGYDPFYAHDRWRYRQDRGWEQRQLTEFQNFRDNEGARPPRTWAAYQATSGRAARGGDRSPRIAASLEDYSRNTDGSLRFRTVDQSERQRYSQRAQEVRRLRDERLKLETAATDVRPEGRARQSAPGRVRFPGSPIRARSGEELGKDASPPKIVEAPKPDPKVPATPRARRSLEQPGQPREHTVGRRPLDEPKARPEVKPQPKVEQVGPKIQQQPKAERVAPQPRREPKAEKAAPKPQQQPKAEKAAPRSQQQPKAQRAARQPRQEATKQSKQDKSKGKD